MAPASDLDGAVVTLLVPSLPPNALTYRFSRDKHDFLFVKSSARIDSTRLHFGGLRAWVGPTKFDWFRCS